MSLDVKRRIAAALEVRWTPALANRVRRRIEARIARARRRRRLLTVVGALLFVAGAGWAFPRLRERWTSRETPSSAARRPHGAVAPARPPAETVPAAPPPSLAPTPKPEAVPSGLPRARAEGSASENGGGRTAAHRPAARSTVEALFAAADAARLAGHPAAAVAPLSAIVTRHPDDPRAAVAAFQLGRVFADELADPARAAAAFERARALDPSGPLAADAAGRADEARRALARGAR
jgi:TolA-binding protein